MKTITINTVLLWRPVLFVLLAGMAVCPVNAQLDDLLAIDGALGRPENSAVSHESPQALTLERNTVLYLGPMVHDQQWVLSYGTTNNQILGVFGGNCSMVLSNVSNVRGLEQVRFESEYQGLGVWKMAWVDTVVGSAVAATGQRYRYTYHVRHSYTGITTDGKAPNPSRAMPTPTSDGFLEVVPGNVVAPTLEFQDTFLLLDEATGHLVADAQVLGQFHLRTDPSEEPPAFFPFVLDGYIANALQTAAGQAGCDPL